MKHRKDIRIFALPGFILFALLLGACAGGSAPAEPRQRRADSNAAAKPELPKIVAFGDSLTAGFGISEKESYPYLLQERLRADGYNYEVVNAGVSGDTSLGGLERIDWTLEQDRIEILILELGANDLLRGMPVSKMKQNLTEIIRRAKAKGVKVLLCGMLAPPTMGSDYQREFITAFPDLASEHKVAFLPFLLEGVAMDRDLNQADGIHPNAEGTRLMMENIYKELKPMLTK
jgi:acyl-CoA thioesterase-1